MINVLSGQFADAGIQLDSNATLNFTNAAGITGPNFNLSVQGNNTSSRGTVTGPIALGSGGFTEFGSGRRFEGLNRLLAPNSQGT